MSTNETCEFCSKDFIGFVVMIDGSIPWVCEDHWDMYATKTPTTFGN